MSHDLYSCRRCDFYGNLHAPRRSRQFIGGLQDRHLSFELGNGLPFAGLNLRVRITLGTNPTDSYVFPPWRDRPLPTISRNRRQFLVLDAPLARRGLVELWVYRSLDEPATLIPLDGGDESGPPRRMYARDITYGRSNFNTSSPRLPVLCFMVWQGSTVMSPGSSGDSHTDPGRSSEIGGGGEITIEPVGLGGGGDFHVSETTEWHGETRTRDHAEAPQMYYVPHLYHMAQLSEGALTQRAAHY